ncbi:MAG: hypothetical protein ACFFDF_19220 [Candidatus Odinarchaeota archaeon]
MNSCKICMKEIDDKYKYCWNCNLKRQKEAKSHLETFTCAICKKIMYSMKWPGVLCCSCYSYSQSKKKNVCNKGI